MTFSRVAVVLRHDLTSVLDNLPRLHTSTETRDSTGEPEEEPKIEKNMSPGPVLKAALSWLRFYCWSEPH